MSRVAVLGGDGIGPEVTAAAVRVLELVMPSCTFVEAPVGADAIARSGTPLPAATLALARASDAVLFGAVGGPGFDDRAPAERPEAAILGLRKAFGLYANVRPARAFTGLDAFSSLRPELVHGMDLVIVREPRAFDVIVTENTFGDILSDEAAMLTGSIGNLPSASLGARVTGFGRYGMYEPVSGTAPDIAGTGVANPVAAILSAAMLARYSLSDERAARRIEEAVDAAMSAGVRTADMAGESPPVGTAAFGDRILRMLAASQETVPR